MACSTNLLLLCFVVAGIFAYPLDNKQENETVKDSFQPVSLPTDFGSYDPNANGYIDLEELAKVTGTTLDDARKPFMDADIDDDDQVSPSEFERAPWSLSIFNREELVSQEGDNDEQIDDDGDDEEDGMQDDSDDHIQDDSDDRTQDDSDEPAQDDSDEPTQDDSDDDDDDDENIFDNADDILVDVGKPVTEEEDEMDKSVSTGENEDEMPEEEPLEEDDDEARNIDSDEEETDENEEDESNDYDVSDPLLDDDASKQQTIITEEEFVENSIY